jgi:hypothetical protein
LNAQLDENFASHSSTSYPPTSALLPLAVDDMYAEALFTVHTYFGPMFVGDVTPVLSLSGDTSALAFDPSFEAEFNASSTFTYQFSLNAAHPYTFNSSELGLFVDVRLTGINGNMPTGSGILPAGDYEFQAVSFATFGQNASNSFSLQLSAVPEAPAWIMPSLASIGLAGYAAWKKHRRPNALASR